MYIKSIYLFVLTIINRVLMFGFVPNPYAFVMYTLAYLNRDRIRGELDKSGLYYKPKRLKFLWYFLDDSIHADRNFVDYRTIERNPGGGAVHETSNAFLAYLYSMRWASIRNSMVNYRNYHRLGSCINKPSNEDNYCGKFTYVRERRYSYAFDCKKQIFGFTVRFGWSLGSGRFEGLGLRKD